MQNGSPSTPEETEQSLAAARGAELADPAGGRAEPAAEAAAAAVAAAAAAAASATAGISPIVILRTRPSPGEIRVTADEEHVCGAAGRFRFVGRFRFTDRRDTSKDAWFISFRFVHSRSFTNEETTKEKQEDRRGAGVPNVR